jgi:hypothetical protein
VANESAELERIRAAYRERDAAAGAAYSWADPGYRFHMQELEWALLHELGRAGVALGAAEVLEVGCGSGYFLHRLRARRAGGEALVTPTTPIELDELSALFPHCDLAHRVMSLNFDLGRQAARGRLLAMAAAALPFLRTHLLAIARKR